MAISNVASAPITPTASIPVAPSPELSRSARLDLLAAAALGFAGVVASLVVFLAITHP
ncbi:hypothetical protein OH146_03100 [Salinibacterium sp. SYSU T00001]|uniref:hypothetical protein n=1 Tax=Homoserinimonas sedimenticola TaxID=2986805 RepID=UPI002236800F|nr:hypothetical protein [Salinibacterium sedimenticola]MCW4384756.1 hypothetical protein [Salinibacterium sedimenticola]